MVLSILITHYNRSQALKDCLNSFKELKLNIPLEFVVSDDCSTINHLEELKKIDSINLIQSELNLGLGANINKGLKNCSGDFILYCQEDFLIKSSFVNVVTEIIDLLQKDEVDMVRLTANYTFPKVFPISKNVCLIPKLSIKNFLYNAFQYSDHPFIVKKGFYEENGFYLENVAGSYCETEFAIRIMSSKVKVGILNEYVFGPSIYESVLNYKTKMRKIRMKQLYRYLRAVRFHIEWLFYNPKKRELITFNKRLHHLIKNESKK